MLMKPVSRSPFVVLTIVAIVLLAFASVGPVVYKALTSTGIKTGEIHTDGALPASTDMEGTWEVIHGSGANMTSVGYTFHEILPGEDKDTSGSTHDVTGTVTVTGTQLTQAKIVVAMDTLETDVEKRDINVRRGILHTEDYPEAVFAVDKPVSLDGITEDGTVGHVTVPGVLTLHGVSKNVDAPLDILRTGNRVIIGGTVPINRLDFDVQTPEFVAAVIDEQGELNIRLTLEKV